MSDDPMTIEELEADVASLRCDATGSKRPCYHMVVKGDTMHEIAATYRVSIDDLRRWNPRLFPAKGSPDRPPAERPLIIKGVGAP
jgi:hypothetical protein